MLACRFTLSRVAAVCLLPCLLAGSAGAISVRLSQESAPGARDFDGNVLGTVTAYETDLSASEYYGWGDWVPGAFSGPAPELLSNTSHVFFINSSVDGLCAFFVHDAPLDWSGGRATMRLRLDGDDASLLAADDPWPLDWYLPSGQGMIATHDWTGLATDGLAVGSLDGDWRLYAALRGVVGLDAWKGFSADGSTQDLALRHNQVVRFDVVDDGPLPSAVPEPLTMLTLAGGIWGVGRYARRRFAR